MFVIRTYGDPVLRTTAKPVTRFDEDLKAFADEMVVTMRQEDGVGLAATQVGKTIRLAVVDVTGGEGEAYVLINPFITWSSDDKAVEEEGCLSLPGIPRYKISRPARVTVRAYDCAGKEFTIEKADGLLARAMQHEIDHLNGIMYVDHLSPLQRKLLSGKLRKLAKSGGETE
ncbi:MAG: peptide deformylase [Chitinispirillaceae bacterium]|nr:peptide deformylase [Chitinispirillaceae bacterium]